MSEITKEEIESFTAVLYQKFGLDFTCYESQSLNRRLNRVLFVLKKESIHDLWAAMLQDNTLIYRFMDEISVGLTSMFRDPQMWSGLRSILFNEFKSNTKFDVWNAGCSTGEEVYSLAIVLKEMGILNSANIVASDMNHTALNVAKNGIYHKVKMIDYEKKFKEYNKYGYFNKYYSIHDDNHVIMDRELIKGVNYKYHNLITDEFTGEYDFIFCRNVMIYFDAPTKERLIQQFYDILKPGGYLITGFFDSMLSDEEKQRFDCKLSNLRILRKPAKINVAAGSTYNF